MTGFTPPAARRLAPHSPERLLGSLLRLDRALHASADPRALLARAATRLARGQPDPEHGARVAALAERVALAMGWPESRAERLACAAALHDLGKAALHDLGKAALPRSLLWHPGPLSPGQRRRLCGHAALGASLLAHARHPLLRQAALVARAHHERWDGLGYPGALAGDEIPVTARVTCAADVWDALTHDRPGRAALPPGEAARHVRRMRGFVLDPEAADALLREVLG